MLKRAVLGVFLFALSCSLLEPPEEFKADLSEAIRKSADSTPPVVSIQYPVDGMVVKSSFVISGKASDNKGVVRVEVRIDGGKWQVAGASVDDWSKWTFYVSDLEDGQHTIQVRAFDEVGNSAVDSVAVVVIDSVYVATYGSDLNSGTKNSPFRTIQKAVDFASLNGFSRVLVAEGVYLPSEEDVGFFVRMRNGVSIIGGYSSNFTERNPEVYQTVVEDPSNIVEVLFLVRDISDFSTKIDGLVIRNHSYSTEPGNAIRVENYSRLRVVNSRIDGITNTSGSVIYLDSSALVLSNVIITNCHGNPLWGDVWVTRYSLLKMIDSSFCDAQVALSRDNAYSSDYYPWGKAEITGCHFWKSYVSVEGYGSYEKEDLVISNSVFSDGSHIDDAHGFVVSDCSFVDSYVRVSYNRERIIRNCLFTTTNEVPTFSYAVYLNSGVSTVSVENSTFRYVYPLYLTNSCPSNFVGNTIVSNRIVMVSNGIVKDDPSLLNSITGFLNNTVIIPEVPAFKEVYVLEGSEGGDGTASSPLGDLNTALNYLFCIRATNALVKLSGDFEADYSRILGRCVLSGGWNSDFSSVSGFSVVSNFKLSGEVSLLVLSNIVINGMYLDSSNAVLDFTGTSLISNRGIFVSRYGDRLINGTAVLTTTPAVSNGVGNLEVSNFTFSNCTYTGGALWASSSVHLKVYDCSFVSNYRSIYSGGGLTVDRCRFEGASKWEIYWVGSYNQAVIENSLFSHSSGGIRKDASYGNLELINCTLVSNEKEAFHNFNYGTEKVINCIFFGNSCGIYGAVSIEVMSNNCFSNNSTNIFMTPNVYNSEADINGISGSGSNIVADPGFADATLFHISSSSTCVNNGFDVSSIILINRDIDGETRPKGSGWDIGSDEY